MRYELKAHPDGGYGCWDKQFESWSSFEKNGQKRFSTPAKAQRLVDYLLKLEQTMNKVTGAVQAQRYLVNSIAASMSEGQTIQQMNPHGRYVDIKISCQI